MSFALRSDRIQIPMIRMRSLYLFRYEGGVFPIRSMRVYISNRVELQGTVIFDSLDGMAL